VLVEQVDPVGAEPAQGGVGDLLDVLRAAGQTVLAAVGVDVEAELRSDDDLVADPGEGLAEEFLVDEGTVELGRVEEGDAAFDRGADDADHLVTISGLGAVAHSHAAQADDRDLQTAGTQDSFLHDLSPYR